MNYRGSMKAKDIYPIPRGRSYLSLYQEVADNLNRQGKLPFRGREYTLGIVQSHVHRKIIDDNVEQELKRITEQWLKENQELTHQSFTILKLD